MRTALLLALMARFRAAQTIEVESLFQPAPLSGMWKHQAGDHPRWADPAFDDSAWPSVRMPEGAVQLVDGFRWFRVRIRLPENMPKEPLALLIGGFGLSHSYEVFWNGQRAGAMGEPDGGLWGQRIPVPKAFPAPGHDRDAVVAIRLCTASSRLIIPKHPASSIGSSDAIRERVEALRGERLLGVLPQLLIAASLLLSGVLFLLLPLWRPDAPEYFWFGLWLLSANGLRVFQVCPDAVGIEGTFAAICGVALASLGVLSGWFGWMRTLFLGGITQLLWLVLAAFVALILGTTAFNMAGGTVSTSFLLGLSILGNCALIFGYYQLGWRTSRAADRMPAVHIAILAYFAVNFVTYGALLFWRTEAIFLQGALARMVSALLFTFATTVLMSQRSARLLGERQRLSGELASAAEVQSLLLTSLPDAGDSYRIEPVYLPASEVGGNFYQVLERADGSRVVLVGDVSGKGLKAAMLVSVCVGMVRRERSSPPAEILAGLNEGLAGRGSGGFVTCCCARFDADGTVTIANAGHPSPYVDGREVEMEAGLPLGIAPGVEYAELVTRGEHFTLVSDGVVEAENAQRELFGFERTREISGQSAHEIADAAKAWGQNDDITVVTVRRNV